MLACRSISCGRDLRNYKYFFEIIKNLQFSEMLEYFPTEQLYFSLNWIVTRIYPDFRLLLVITAVLCAGITGWFYKRESEYPLLTILLFITNTCFVMFYSGLRQSLAMLFIIPAYYLTKQKRLIPFIVVVLIAKLFHNSAIIMLLLYPVFHIQLLSKDFLGMMFLVALVFVLKVEIFSMVVPFLNDKYARGGVAETGAYAVWLMFLLYLIYSFLVLDDSKMNKECLGLRNVLVIMTLIQSFASINPLAMRMNYYFIMLFPIIIPKLMNYPKVGNENIVQESKWGMVLLFVIYFFIHINSGYTGLEAFPYVAFWE
ncbi:EpsG family protein [bacterium]|nr:EpsG family protein [bacterium]